MRHGVFFGGAIVGLLCAAVAEGAEETAAEAVLVSEFIYEQAPYPECHASTIESTARGLAAAWFGGTREGRADVGIWFARRGESGWSVPKEVANGLQAVREAGEPDRYPCWNPVLFQAADGPLLLFYKVGPSPSKWWGMVIESSDGGDTWSDPKRLPDGILGPIKNKPVMLSGGTLVCGSSTEDAGWRVHMELTPDLGKTWTKAAPPTGDEPLEVIQPAILTHGDGRLQILCRSKHGKIADAWSSDGGRTWGKLGLTEVPNPNSGIDAVTLADGRHLLVYNPVAPPPGKWGGPRTPLAVALSGDGKAWQRVLTLETEPGEYSYPAVIQSDDGVVHITYTWKRRKVKHVAVDAEKLTVQ